MATKTILDGHRAKVPDNSDGAAGAAQQTVQRIMNGLAETVLSISDEDLLAESREQGLDPHEEAAEVRKVLTDALRAVGNDEELTPEKVTQ